LQLFADASSVQAPLKCMVEAEIVPATGNLCLNRRPPLSAWPPARCEASRRQKPNREVNQIAETRESKESKRSELGWVEGPIFVNRFPGSRMHWALWGNGVKKLRDFSRNAMTHLKKKARSDEH
jgi:hypothetical protein